MKESSFLNVGCQKIRGLRSMPRSLPVSFSRPILVFPFRPQNQALPKGTVMEFYRGLFSTSTSTNGKCDILG